ncbi:branched-chain amino acid ABC transporter permease [Tistrella mobilis]|uniref:Inner-membrane translocator n=1 Tax=Tistrella mobilis (strain KA081020-065) TaxID=1110502 RepID=I3TS30_TISMK|nr:branched-chain amino acid ABC transporter permease [Tistrella mobilis]AFK55568.1 inner-membrane translocator [Tistrella mobilis KA081020-065]
MFYRRAGVRHTSYAADRRLWPLAFDRRLILLLAVLAIAAPWWLTPLYLTAWALPMVIWATAAMGLNLLMGGAGQIHLGYAAVMAIGAYASIHLARAGLPFELAVIGGGLAAAAIGSLFGAAALRVKGLYLAISTLAMQYIVDFAISHVPAISGGAQATLQAPPVVLLGVIPIAGDAGRWWVALAVAILTASFLLNVRRTGYGRALATIRDKDYAAEVIGVNVFRYKLSAFWTASFIGGVAGAILAFCYYRAITPEQFHLDVSIQLVAMVIVGGLGSVLGSVLGAAFIFAVPLILNMAVLGVVEAAGLDLSQELVAHIPLAAYGALIIGFLLAEPLGLAKIYDNIRKYLMVWPFRHFG